MIKINLITYPDILYNNSYQLLVMYPSNELKKEIQEKLYNSSMNLNVYYYDSITNSFEEIEWLLNVLSIANVSILDIDNTQGTSRNLISYIIAKPTVYWLTNATQSIYTLISNNRIYTLDFLNSIGGSVESQEKQNQV